MSPSVLIVEDEPDLRAVFRLALRLEGYDVWEASSGEEALSMLAARRPDAVILDIRLPGIDGFEVLTQLRSSVALCSLAVILCSAHATPASVAEIDRQTTFIPEPLHPERLIAALRDHLAEPPTTPIIE